MPAVTSINLCGLEHQVSIVAASKGQSRSAYIRDLIKSAIELETSRNEALRTLLAAA